ncbi:hypothetical protein [Nocardioides daphniae]|uniref:Uncharacterized protein n=1 Tax=Nocardioides daphniae TaxID=402297 RepID=A0A4P7UBD6_9ACTN|nr:hypothetical protein [Nocardioides daphniae]QCC76249.1 hypothetical protein E2C04_01755 [Nocardioides daphniae]GGD08648.1 hypothetical protein GCM10007231_04350 [Nocardioides daphniae]
MDLDHLLADSAPATTRRTDALRAELRALVLATEPAPAVRRLSSVRVGVAAAAASVFLGVGVVGAAASGLLPTPAWVPWATESGSACEMEFSVAPALVDGGQANGEPLSRSYSAAEQE